MSIEWSKGWSLILSSLNSYRKGQANHAVVTVGWGTENNVPYWLIKNSWGTGYGDKGYIKVKRGR